MTTTERKQITGTLLLLLTALIWGCAFVAQSVGAQSVGTFTFLAGRSWLGGMMLIPLSLIKRKNTTSVQKGKAGLKMLLLGGLFCGLCLFAASAAQQEGMAFTTTAKGSFITALYVLIVPVISVFAGKRVGIKVWLGVAVGLVGLYLLCLTDGFRLNTGDALVLISAFLYAAHIMVINKFVPYCDGVRLSCLQFLITAAIATVCAFIFEDVPFAGIGQAALPILYAGIMSTGVGYTLQIIAQKGMDPTVAGLTMSLESVFGALAGWVILGQSLKTVEICGCVLMFIAIILAQLPSRKKKEKIANG